MTTSPSRRPSGDPRRQLLLLKITVAVLLTTAFLILVVPGPIPKPIRITVATTDLVAAAAIWLLGRQRLNR